MIPPKLTCDQVARLCPGFSDIREIGAGGFKTVYAATWGGQPEVIKVISIPRADGSTDTDQFCEECLGRVEREVAILRRCTSPYLVRLASMPLTPQEVNGNCYAIYSEEYLDGPDLWKLVRAKTARPDEREVKMLMKCLLHAIKELWGMRYIHRDIKPANVIKLSDEQRPFVLIDLGIAFGLLETGLTYNASFRDPPATFRYLAPEMANPAFRSNLDYRSDLYTAALTCFEYAAGQHPIARDSDDLVRTVTRALHDAPKPLHQLRPDFSLVFCRLIDQLLKKKPALRPANLDSLIKQMEA
ncbi:MAG TPA: hypothetical protein DIT64_18145 [Verrucomicrobiales bacterium]|nr:hypothetical protein [Verrucomicrobiales bacterium]